MNSMGLATICVAFPEHCSEASAIASILPALVKEKLSEECHSWFTQINAKRFVSTLRIIP
jgi:hypothetical protein